jgi:hypothetical protein
MTRSFPITAAGQSWCFTGFPLATPGRQANRRSESTLLQPPFTAKRDGGLVGEYGPAFPTPYDLGLLIGGTMPFERYAFTSLP